MADRTSVSLLSILGGRWTCLGSHGVRFASTNEPVSDASRERRSTSVDQPAGDQPDEEHHHLKRPRRNGIVFEVGVV